MIRNIAKMFIRIVCYIILAFFVIIQLVACSAPPEKGRQAKPIAPAAAAKYYDEDAEDLPPSYPTKSLPNGNMWDEFGDHLSLKTNPNNGSVRANIRWFQRHQDYLNHSIARGAPYLYHIYQQTCKLGLPAELALIPLNESAYNPFLYSRTGATGLWQMMPGTASGFGLRINWWYDGRRDVVASTKAALKYLTYLHYFFDDWLLAIAAYNCGEGRVQAEILRNQRRGLPTDFWSLNLPKQTKDYVPKLLALAAVVKNPGNYNVSLVGVNNGNYFDQIDVGSQIDLNQAAKLADVTPKTLRMLNPGYRRWAIDPDGPYTLVLPQEKIELFQKNLTALPEDQRVTWQQHTVASGENLQSIATKYHIDVTSLRKINELSSNHAKPGQELLIPNGHHDDSEVTMGVHNASVAEEKIPGPKQVVHTVAEGETLRDVARKYGVKPQAVAYWNQLDSNSTVEADDELVIWKDPSSASSKPVKIRVFSYRVRSGDTLFGVAKRYHVPAAKLASINHIKHNAIHPGQVLKIPGKSKHKTAAHGKTYNKKTVKNQPHSKKHKKKSGQTSSAKF